jgi:hypothetical protein
MATMSNLRKSQGLGFSLVFQLDAPGALGVVPGIGGGAAPAGVLLISLCMTSLLPDWPVFVPREQCDAAITN